MLCIHYELKNVTRKRKFCLLIRCLRGDWGCFAMQRSGPIIFLSAISYWTCLYSFLIIMPGNNNSKDNNQYLYSIPQVSLLAGSLCFRKNNWASFASNFNQMYLFYEHLWHPALHAFFSKVVTYILPTVLSNDGIRNKITCLYMLWFDFILGLNFILLFQTHYLTLPYPKKTK